MASGPERFSAVASRPVPSGLVSTSAWPGWPPALVSRPRFPGGSRDGAGNRHAVDRLWPVDRVTAGHHPAAVGRGIRAAGEHLAQQVQREDVAGPSRQVEGEQRAGAHGVDVAGGVGGRDAPPRARIVHDRREEISRRHQQPVAVEPPHGGIVAGLGADHQVRVRRGSQMAQNLRQLGGPELARSARTVAVLAQPERRAVRSAVGGHSGNGTDVAAPSAGI